MPHKLVHPFDECTQVHYFLFLFFTGGFRGSFGMHISGRDNQGVLHLDGLVGRVTWIFSDYWLHGVRHDERPFNMISQRASKKASFSTRVKYSLLYDGVAKTHCH
jgi:hypothetical protein